MIEIIPNLHPIFVHFTVTIIVLTGLLQFIFWLSKDRFNSSIVIGMQKWLTVIGSISVIVTIASGLYAASTVNHDTASHLAMLNHRDWAIPTGLVFLLGSTVFLFLPNRRQTVAGILFSVALLLVTITAFKGGELVYRYGLGVLSLPEVTGDGHDHEHADEMVQPDSTPEENKSEVESMPPQEEHSHDKTDGHHNNKSSALFSGLDNEAAKVVTAFHDALNSGNEQRAKMLLSDDVLIFEGGGVERSAKQYADHHMKSDIAFMSKMQVTLLEHQVQGNGDMAVSMARSKIQGRYKDKDIDIETMETMVLRKHDGNWRILHIHWSN